MFWNDDKLSATNSDNDFYRLFLAIVCCLNIIFHYLNLNYSPESFDPLSLRIVCSVLCLITILISFWNQGIYYKFATYLTLILFLGINNCYLLGLNNFIGEYFFDAITSLILISFFCRRDFEVALLVVLNIAAFICSLFLVTTFVEMQILVVTEILVMVLIFFLFLYRKTYILRFEKAVFNLESNKIALHQTNDWLSRNIDLVQSLAAANKDIVFECDQDQIILSQWYPIHDLPKKKVDYFINSQAEILGIPALSNHLTIAGQTLEPVNFEFYSFLGNNHWYNASITPVFNGTSFAGRLMLTLSKVTELKIKANKLKENELILYNEQVIAKIGSWWTDVAGGDISWSNNLFSIMEVGQIPLNMSKLGYYISLIHPDDQEDARLYFTTLVSNPLNEFEHRLITPRGNLKYFKVVSGFPVKDDEGNVTKIAGIIQDITEIKAADKIIRKSQAELIEVQAIAKIGGWNWDINTNNLAWSDEIYTIYEIDKNAVKNADHFKLLLAFVHPDDKEMVSVAFRDYLKLARSFVEYRIITSTGKLKYLSIIIGKTIKKDGAVKRIIGTLQDLTERKKIEFDFEQAENKYKNVLTTINLAAVTLNKHGIIVFCNKHLADIVGYDRIEMTGMSWVDNFVPDYLKEQFTSWLQTNSFQAQHTSPINCRNGKQRIINWKNTVTHDEFGEISETTSIGEDITDIKKAREALILAKENAEKSSRFKSEFLSIMSHEIRTPMNAVIGTTNLLLQDNPLPAQMEYLNTLKYSSNNLLELINDILDYNKIEAGKLELYKLPFNVQKLVQNILHSFANKAEENSTSLDLLIDEAVPPNLIGDQLRLGQILNNLISNAVKFTRNGRVTVNLSAGENRHDKVVINFSVKDTGIGIAPENIERIFDPFTQEYQSTQNDYGGTGLGLAITKRLIELHRSHINLVSKPGVGSEFAFSIVFEKAEVNDPSEIEPLTSENNVKGMNILLVDDNKMNLLIATKFLKNWQATVEQAGNGKIAVEMANAGNYDLVIMDLQMPVMDGFEAARLIKQSQPDLPIIALSADAMPETNAKALRSGMVDYMTKPFVPEVLFNKVSRHYKPLAVN